MPFSGAPLRSAVLFVFGRSHTQIGAHIFYTTPLSNPIRLEQIGVALFVTAIMRVAPKMLSQLGLLT